MVIGIRVEARIFKQEQSNMQTSYFTMVAKDDQSNSMLVQD
jgi:acyl-CoA hydrolase